MSQGFKCLHKPKMLVCRECKMNFCARCIQLEVHFCPKLSTRSSTEKSQLAEKLVKVVAPKVLPI